MPAQPLLDLGRIPLDPPVDRRVIDRHAALGHHLLEIAIAYAVAAIPAHRPEHDLACEVAPFEVRHGPPPSLEPFPSRSAEGFATEPSRASSLRSGTRRRVRAPASSTVATRNRSPDW